MNVQSFQLETVPRSKRLLFNLLNFEYFRRSDYDGTSLLEAGPLSILIVVPYVLFSEIYFFRHRRFFLTVGEQVVGVLALEERSDMLYISNLAVSSSHRRMGAGTCLLNFADRLARHVGKQELELSVNKANVPALKLYTKKGFTKVRERRRSYLLRKDVSTQS